MRNRIRIALSSLALLAGLSWQGCDTAGDFDPPDQDYFVKYYGSSLGNHTGVDMVVNADGTMVAVGISQVGSTSRSYFLKLDALGNVLTEKYLSGPTDRAVDLEALGNDTYLILSQFVVEGSGNLDTKLVRLSGDGTKIDSVTVGTIRSGTEYDDYPRKISLMSGGRILVNGSSDNVSDNSTDDPDFGDFVCFAFITSPSLAVDPGWDFGLGDFKTGDFDEFVGAFDGKTSDGVDVICVVGASSTILGTANTSGGNQTLMYGSMEPADGVFKTPAVVKDIPNGANATIGDVIKVESTNGGYFFVGSMRLSNGRTELYFGKLRENWNFKVEDDLQFHDRYVPAGANNIAGVSVCRSNVAPQGYLIAGVDTKQTGSTDTWILKIDLSGQVVWTSRFGSDQGDDAAACIAELPDGRVVVLGTTELGDNQSKLSLIKMNSSGKLLR